MTGTHPDVEILSAFAAGQLTALNSDTVAHHVAHCDSCRARLDDLPAISRLEQQLLGLGNDQKPTCEFPGQSWLHELKQLQPFGGTAEAEVLKQLQASAEDGTLGRLGRYQVLSKIGSGGMGCVFLAVHPVMDRQVALKVIAPRFLRSPEAIARFQREVRAVSRLHHPHIVTAYDADSVGDVQFLVMEYVEGEDLERLIRRAGPLPPDRAAEYARQAALALEHAAEKGMVHRDIKPANLILTKSGQIKLLDLGLARLTQEQRLGHETDCDVMLGTPDYMAPEQATSPHEADTRADIYSLGCTLYYLLTGRLPFPHANAVRKLLAHQSQSPEPLAKLRPDLPASLIAVVERMMAKNPSDRLATPHAVCEALAPFAVAAPAPGNTDRGKRPRVAQWFAAALLVGAATTVIVQTDKGILEVETVDESVEVLVQKNGALVKLVDRNTGWKVRIPSGNYSLTLGPGNNELILDGDGTTQIKRGTTTVARIRHKPAIIATKATSPKLVTAIKTAAVTAPQKTPVSANAIDLEKVTNTKRDSPPARTSGPETAEPFVLSSTAGERRGEFKHLADAIAQMRNRDVIEVRSNGQFVVEQVTLSGRGLTIKAAAGFRPTFLPSPALRADEWWLEILGGDLVLDGCDFRGLGKTWMLMGHGQDWQVRNCRFLGPIRQFVNFNGQKLRCENCLIATHGPLCAIGGNSEFQLVNNLIWYEGDGIGLVAPGGQMVRLESNTFVRSVHHAAPLIDYHGTQDSPQQPIQVEAVGNVFQIAGRIITQLPYYADWLDQLRWQGRDNVYVESSLAVRSRDGQDIVTDMTGWNQRWGHEERSRQAPTIRFAWDQLMMPPTEAAIQSLREVVEGVRGQDVPVSAASGPDWDLVGPGKAYARALAARQEPLPDVLPAPVPAAGPFALLRDGRIRESHPSLLAAVEACTDADVLEIYSQDRSMSCTFPANKRTRLRAAPGYEPGMEGHLAHVASMEGIYFSKPLLTRGTHRFINCAFADDLLIESFDEPGADQGPLELINCWIAGRLIIDPPAGRKMILNNTVVGRVILKGSGEYGCAMELDRCLIWNPGPATLTLGIVGPAFFNASAKKLDIMVSRTIVESGHGLAYVYDKGDLRWSGLQNVYRIGGQWANAGPGLVPCLLDDWRQLQNVVESNSVTSDPVHADPLQWRLLPSSPGHAAGPNGRDLGADVDRVAN